MQFSNFGSTQVCQNHALQVNTLTDTILQCKGVEDEYCQLWSHTQSVRCNCNAFKN